MSLCMHTTTLNFALLGLQAEHQEEGRKKYSLSIFCGKIPQEALQLQDFTKIKKGAACTWSLSENNIYFFFLNKWVPLMR